MKETYSTFLPCFPGFYESPLYNSDSESEAARTMIDALCSSESVSFPAPLLKHYFNHHHLGSAFDLQADFPAFTRDAAKAYCRVIADRLAGILEEEVSIEFEEIRSPKYYNFETDSVNCKITFDADRALAYCREHLPKFRQYLVDNYKSRDGFISFHSYDAAEWLDSGLWGSHEPGAILDFILRNEDPDVEINASERVLEEVRYLDYFQTPPALDRYLESPEAKALGQEYARLMKQGDDYIEIMGGGIKYRNMIREAKEKVLDDLLGEMESALAEIAEIA